MLTPEELKALAADIESDRVERTLSTTDTDKFREAICAFANDMPGHGKPGYLLIGAADDGSIPGVAVTDKLLLKLADRRDDGRIDPIPTMSVYKVQVDPSIAVAVVEVHPSDAPPVRANGVIWIRVGPRRAIASRDDEGRLNERRTAKRSEWDGRPCAGATVADLSVEEFRLNYLPQVVAPAVLAQNDRTLEEQLASLRLFHPKAACPTNGGVISFGVNPPGFFPGAYVQFVRFDGPDPGAPATDSKELTGSIATQLRELDVVLKGQIRSARVSAGGLRQRDQPDYALSAVRELVFNAVMHRRYEGETAPVRILWFSDHVEIQNPGGLYGHVTPENFGRVPDYRNPVIAGVIKGLGYVERWGTGVRMARAALAANGNPEPEFTFEPTYFQVTVRARP
jgi:ATP-dependent DNA helicase RecG